MNKSVILFSLLSGTMMFSSCVSKKQFVQLQSDYDKLDKDYQDTKMKLVACGTKSKSLEERLAEAQQANGVVIQWPVCVPGPFQVLECSLTQK